MRNGAEIYIKDCQNLPFWFGCGIGEVFIKFIGPLTSLRADFFLISACDLYGNFQYKNPIF